MENNNKEKVVYAITEELIQQEAEQEIDRELSEAELEQVIDCFYSNGWPIFEFIRDSINNVIELNELSEKTLYAEKSIPHFKLYHKNANTYQPDLKFCAAFESLKEAKRYINLNWDFISEYDQFKITKVDENGESDIEIIGKGKSIDRY